MDRAGYAAHEIWWEAGNIEKYCKKKEVTLKKIAKRKRWHWKRFQKEEVDIKVIAKEGDIKNITKRRRWHWKRLQK